MSQRRPTSVQIDAYAGDFALYGDQSQAWRVAFPNSRCRPDVANVSASKFHQLPKICLRIEERRAELKKQSDEEFNISASEIKKRLLALADAGAKIRIDAQENEVATNISGGVSALSEINKMDGNYASAKVESKVETKVIDSGEPGGEFEW